MSQLEDLQEAKNKQRVGAAISKAVQMSFYAEDVGGTQTEDEIKRRTHICLEYYKIMRNDLRWSISKICDQMPRLLIADLSGMGQEFLDKMQDRGWLKVERRTPNGLILPS